MTPEQQQHIAASKAASAARKAARPKQSKRQRVLPVADAPMDEGSLAESAAAPEQVPQLRIVLQLVQQVMEAGTQAEAGV